MNKFKESVLGNLANKMVEGGYWGTNEGISQLDGKVFHSVYKPDTYSLVFATDTEAYVMYHEQDCCESVEIVDICGDLEDLVNTPIVYAEERSNSSDTDWGSQTWTFYDIQSMKGSVNIRWLGESNGYYSEGVSLKRVPDEIFTEIVLADQ